MNTIVFGGSGFIGSYVADELTARGHEVTIADINESRYLSGNQRFVHCDILDVQRVGRLVTGDTAVVYNFAALADLNEAIHDPLRTMNLNVMGNLHILEACKDKQIKRVVYASSAYAFSKKGSFYGISKHTSEKLIEEYSSRYGLPYTIVRYGSLYGERADQHNYIYNILAAALREGRLVVKGGADDVREYIHAKDAARLSVDIIESDAYRNEHIVLTGFEKMRRRELFQMIKEILGDRIILEFSEETQEGHYHVTPYAFHPNLAKKLIANPFIDMGQGLVECIRHINAELEGSGKPGDLQQE